MSTLDLVHPDDAVTAMERLGSMIEHGPRRDPMRVRARHRTGAWYPVEAVAADLTADASVGGILVTMRDVSGRIEREREHDRLARLVQATTDFVVVVDGQGWHHLGQRRRRRVPVPAFPEDRSGFRFLHLMSEATQAHFVHEVVPTLEREGVWAGEIELIVGDEVVPTSTVLLAERDGGALTEISAISRDIRDRRAFEQELEHRATHDHLTGLPNRMLLIDRLRVAIARSQRAHRRASPSCSAISIGSRW